MLVYALEASDAHLRRFHKSRDCKFLRHVSNQLQEIDLAELTPAIPCRVCYPDSPKIASAKRFCRVCNTTSARPCPHNGGVQVRVSYTVNASSINHAAGEEQTGRVWVWPDRAYRYFNSN